MKLRNKKTGEIGDFNIECIKNRGNYLLLTRNDVPYYDIKKENGNLLSYDTLAELNEEWEDYNPAEPLIKDEKIREAVRAWAEVVPSAQVRYDHNDGRFYTHSEYIQPYSISFPIRLGLEEMTDYTIAELCGEEEE